MAKVVGPLFSIEARGSVGDKTYSTHRGLSVVRTRSGSGVYHTEAQQEVQRATAYLTAAWKAFPAEYRQAWNVYASQHLCCDWTGQPKRLSGYNWFVRINVPPLMWGWHTVDEPPWHPGEFYNPNISVITSNGQVEVLTDCAPEGNPVFCVHDLWLSPWRSVGRKPDFHYAKHHSVQFDGGDFIIDTPATFPARRGIYVRLIQLDNNYIGEWWSLDYTITSL